LDLTRTACCVQGTIRLVTAIETLLHAITAHGLGKTLPVITLESVWQTYYPGAITFIRQIATIIITIAPIKH
jgi:hypothetical protein